MPPPADEQVPEAIPDSPCSFSYKASWFAICTDDTAAVATTFRLIDRRPANWRYGVDTAYPLRASLSNRMIFVTPSVAGWTLAVGDCLPEPDPRSSRFSSLLGELAVRFSDVQYFGNYRVSDYCAWARAIDGKIQRVFCSGNAGEVYCNDGPQSPEEASLGLADLSGLDPDAATSRVIDLEEHLDERRRVLILQGMEPREANLTVRRRFPRPVPEERDVLDLAGKWSIDPRGFDQLREPLGVGIVGLLPEHWAQPAN
jgi:hypothetical protein